MKGKWVAFATLLNLATVIFICLMAYQSSRFLESEEYDKMIEDSVMKVLNTQQYLSLRDEIQDFTKFHRCMNDRMDCRSYKVEMAKTVGGQSLKEEIFPLVEYCAIVLKYGCDFHCIDSQNSVYVPPTD